MVVVVQRGEGDTKWSTDAHFGLTRKSLRLMITASYIVDVAIALADGISRWDRPSISTNVRNIRPYVCWREQVLDRAGVDLCLGI